MSRRYVVSGIRVGRVMAIVHDGCVVKGRVVKGGGGTRVFVRLTGTSKFYTVTINPQDEGVTWCRDWNSPGADALRTVVLLRPAG